MNDDSMLRDAILEQAQQLLSEIEYLPRKNRGFLKDVLQRNGDITDRQEAYVELLWQRYLGDGKGEWPFPDKRKGRQSKGQYLQQ